MTPHIDVFVDESGDDQSRRAKVNRTKEQGVVGVLIFLTAEELEQQGIDPEDTDEVVLRVEDRFLLLDHPGSDE